MYGERQTDRQKDGGGADISMDSLQPFSVPLS